MKPWQHTVLIFTLILVILSLLLSACGPVEKQHGRLDNGKVRVKGKGPDQAKNKDKARVQNNDNGGHADKVLICHRTGSTKKPYVQIRVANDALKQGHGAHAGDLIPAPADGCPKTVPSSYP